MNSYEVQLVPSARGQGLGQRLMGEMESIGRRMGMEKAMLTCLRSASLSFFCACPLSFYPSLAWRATPSRRSAGICRARRHGQICGYHYYRRFQPAHP